MATNEIVDAEVVKFEIVEYIGGSIMEAQALALSVKDDESADRATDLGVAIKGKLAWLKNKRKEVYEPLYAATERVRSEFDEPIRLGAQIEKTLSSAVIGYKLAKKREEERLRLAAEAEARRVREEAARKEREAEAERQRVIREQEERERQRLAALEAEERRKKAVAAAAETAERAKIQREQDERAKRIRDEEDSRLRQAQEATDVGLQEKVDPILDRQTPIAPVAPELPKPDDGAAERARQAQEEAQERERRAAMAAEAKRRDEEAALVRQKQDEADQARAAADAAEAAAASQVSVARPDDRMRTSVRWRYEIPDLASFLKLVRAVADGRAPVEYLGFSSHEPEKYRISAIGNDVTKLKGEFNGDPIGIRTWSEEQGGFRA